MVGSMNGHSRIGRSRCGHFGNGRFRNGHVRNGRSRIGRSGIGASVVFLGSARYFYALNTYGAILLQNLKKFEAFLNFSYLVSSSLSIC
jgi:hypothetical protein